MWKEFYLKFSHEKRNIYYACNNNNKKKGGLIAFHLICFLFK